MLIIFGIKISGLFNNKEEMTLEQVKEIVLKAEYIGEEAVKKKYLNQINKRRESFTFFLNILKSLASCLNFIFETLLITL